MLRFFRQLRRRRIRRAPFPEKWRKFLESSVAQYARLGPEDRRELEGHILVLLAEKKFEGCRGFSVTDQVRLTVAAGAGLLLLHRKTDYYPGLESILVYPGSYLARAQEEGPVGTVTEYDEERLGESWARGVVVLSWEDVKEDAAGRGDGCNVVLHEFAHQLDHENEEMDGVPLLDKQSDYESWARVMGEEYESLQDAEERGWSTFIDPYGANDPAEFFAVVTEAFFEDPKSLQKKHGELYEELRKFYRQDPARRA